MRERHSRGHGRGGDGGRGQGRGRAVRLLQPGAVPREDLAPARGASAEGGLLDREHVPRHQQRGVWGDTMDGHA